MFRRGLWFCGSLSIAAAAVLAACAQHGGATLPTSPFGGYSVPSSVIPDKKPPKCKGQKTTKQYASLTVTLSTSGGSFCIPEFGSYGGSVAYPSANPSVKLSLISSTKNYSHLPELGSGTAIFYLQLALSGGTTFGSDVSAGGGLTSKKIVPGQPYTIYGQATIDGFKVNFKPCYTTATQGTYGGLIGGIGTLLEGVNVPSAGSGFIEIYSGQQAGTQC
jgi:hypothetical protein